jgi:hypothetical protein
MQILFRESDLVNPVHTILKLDYRVYMGLDFKVRFLKSEGD